MYPRTLLKSVVLTSVLASRLASAAPAEIPCDDISNYTTETLIVLEDTKNMIWVPEASTCLFYTAGHTADAVRISQSSGIATIWDLFRCDLYADRSRVERLDPSDSTGKKTLPADPSYPLRCIFAPEKDSNGVIKINPGTGKPQQSDMERTYFENMSRAMARHCDIFASLMSEVEMEEIPMNGIWGTVEFLELMLGNNPGKVNNIDWFDAALNVQGEFWCRPGEVCHDPTVASRTVANVTTVSSRDNSGHASCSDPAGFEANDYNDW